MSVKVKIRYNPEVLRGRLEDVKKRLPYALEEVFSFTDPLANVDASTVVVETEAQGLANCDLDIYVELDYHSLREMRLRDAPRYIEGAVRRVLGEQFRTKVNIKFTRPRR
ncbi:MAG: hypothetical protein ACK4NX_02020 [Candidatus Paceibacteria bacterium]